MVSRQDGGMLQQLHIKCICGKITKSVISNIDTLNATEACISDLKYNIGKISMGVRGDGCLNMHDLFLFRVFERHDKIVVCAQVHRNMHFTLGYSR